MAKPTLAEVFGPNATQDANTITISKADLATVGLNASANNTAESLLAAILFKAETGLYEGVWNDRPECNIYINRPLSGIKTRPDGTEYEFAAYQVNLFKPIQTGPIPLDPDDY
jgi:hypothetical protein